MRQSNLQNTHKVSSSPKIVTSECPGDKIGNAQPWSRNSCPVFYNNKDSLKMPDASKLNVDNHKNHSDSLARTSSKHYLAAESNESISEGPEAKMRKESSSKMRDENKLECNQKSAYKCKISVSQRYSDRLKSSNESSNSRVRHRETKEKESERQRLHRERLKETRQKSDQSSNPVVSVVHEKDDIKERNVAVTGEVKTPKAEMRDGKSDHGSIPLPQSDKTKEKPNIFIPAVEIPIQGRDMGFTL